MNKRHFNWDGNQKWSANFKLACPSKNFQEREESKRIRRKRWLNVEMIDVPPRNKLHLTHNRDRRLFHNWVGLMRQLPVSSLFKIFTKSPEKVREFVANSVAPFPSYKEGFPHVSHMPWANALSFFIFKCHRHLEQVVWPWCAISLSFSFISCPFFSLEMPYSCTHTY